MSATDQAPADREGPPAVIELATGPNATRGVKREARAAAPNRHTRFSSNPLVWWLEKVGAGNFGRVDFFGQVVGAVLGIFGIAALLAVVS